MSKTEKKIYVTEAAPKPIGPYSQAVMANGMLYCSGQVAIDAITGDFLNGSVEAQTEKVFQNIEAVLASAGLHFRDVVKTTVFLQNMNDFPVFNSVYAKFFSEAPPARSTVAVAALPKNALVEIEVIAMVRS